ncbi:hypothetical protein POM88_044562 [Heracleum sosnowskyi]|uniref:Uncharacterized protein n=1 Tax=Heracleum sosnowskyi TaxID=360622 RepID=A0AAD8H5G2_9APIA|nr:hypothetical protein POM88_044562 [Heracleum sosnowskyi]
MINSSDSERESSNEEDLELIYETSSDSSEESLSPNNNNCQCNEINYWKSIVEMNGLNVLTADQDKALKVIEALTDPDLKRKMIETLIENSIVKKESPLIMEALYQLSEVLSRFQQSNTKETLVSINDLRSEVNLLKSEISQIKKNNEKLSQRITLLETKSPSKVEDNKEIIGTSKPDNNDYLNLLDQVTSQKMVCENNSSN